jgi:hypothetical protein
MNMAAKTKTTPVTIDKGSGLATVFMHTDIGSVSVNGETFSRPASVKGRTWSFECSPQDARDLISSYEFASGSESGVSLTVDERSALEDLKSRSNVEVAKMASALAELAEERVTRNELV